MEQIGIPIFCFHLGSHQHVPLVMSQARNWNPLSPIHLITDQPKDNFPNISVHSVFDYAHSASELSEYYEHKSLNALEFERICFQRWLVLSEVLKSLPYERCFVMDSDVLLFSDITAEHAKYRDSEFTLTHRMSPGESFFSSYIIHEFASYIIEAFKDKDSYVWHMSDALWKYIQTHSQGGGGVSEMTFLYYFAGRYEGRYIENMSIINNATFDHHINTSVPGYEMEYGRKKIYWKENQPYGYHLKKESLIRFLSLHFQGNAKQILHHFLRSRLQSSIIG